MGRDTRLRSFLSYGRADGGGLLRSSKKTIYREVVGGSDGTHNWSDTAEGKRELMREKPQVCLS